MKYSDQDAHSLKLFTGKFLADNIVGSVLVFSLPMILDFFSSVLPLVVYVLWNSIMLCIKFMFITLS